MRSIEEHKQKIESRGVKIVAVSVDPPAVTGEHAAKQGYSYLFLSDEKREVLRAWDLVHEGAFRGADIARPAEFLIDPAGTVRWRNLTESYRERPKGQQLLEALDLAGVPAAQQAVSIRNFLRVNEQICTGGQPTMEELEKLKAEGVRAVINLRQAGEYNADEEAAKARELGLRYVHIPVNTAEPKPEQAGQFLRATDDPANRPAFIHCGTANRVGAFWMIRRVLRDGWSAEKAEEEARKIGLRSENLRQFALDYIAGHKK